MALCVEIKGNGRLVAVDSRGPCESALILGVEEYSQIQGSGVDDLAVAVAGFDESLSDFMAFDLALFGALLTGGALSFITGFMTGLIVRTMKRT